MDFHIVILPLCLPLIHVVLLKSGVTCLPLALNTNLQQHIEYKPKPVYSQSA